MTVQPTVGRMVHYHWQDPVAEGYTAGPTPCAAIVTAVPPHNLEEGKTPTVSLAIFSRIGVWFQDRVVYSEEPRHNTWSWPPRV